MTGRGGGSGTEKRTARFVADLEVFKLDFNRFFSFWVLDTCETDLTEALLDCGTVDKGVKDKKLLNLPSKDDASSLLAESRDEILLGAGECMIVNVIRRLV